jgi:surfeit locus 1 family protein
LINSKRFVFRPFLTLFCGLLIVVFLFLGTWQCLRVIEKETLQQSYDSKQRMPEQSLSELIQQEADGEAMVYRKVSASGTFEIDDAFYVDNVILDGKPGYLLHVPLRLETGQVVLVNRGWVVADKTRGVLPDIVSSSLPVQVRGTLVAPRSKPVMLSDLPRPDLEQEGLWFYVDLEYLSHRLGTTVLPLVLELSPEDALALRVNPTQFDAKVGMHIGYAIQWYVFVLFVLMGYVSMSLRSKNQQSSE